MPSALMRRSGIASVHISKLIGWNPSTVIQAGVGFNYQEIDCIKEQWPDVCFLGFEPNVRVFNKIKETYPGTLVNKAIGDKVEQSTLYYRQRHKDGSTLNKLHDVEGATTLETKVFVSTFDTEMDDIHSCNKPILLWLDCEGNELKALRGGRNFIKYIDMVNVEMTGKPPGVGWCKPWEVHKKLVDYGFVLQYIHTFRSSAGQYDAVYVRPEMFHLEYSNSPCRCKDCGG